MDSSSAVLPHGDVTQILASTDSEPRCLVTGDTQPTGTSVVLLFSWF